MQESKRGKREKLKVNHFEGFYISDEKGRKIYMNDDCSCGHKLKEHQRAISMKFLRPCCDCDDCGDFDLLIFESLIKSI